MPVPLYATPNESSRVIAVAEPGSSNLEHTQAVAELPGWNFAAYTGPITGYIAASNLDRAGQPVSGAPLLIEPDDGSEPIASVIPGSLTSIEPSTTPGFFLVSLQSSIGLYYADPSPIEVVILNEIVGRVDTPENVEPTPEQPAQPAEPAPPRQNPVLVDTSFTLRGTLATKTSFLYFFAPRYNYMLKDEEGARLAWLELDGAVLARPLSALIGKEVVIYGERRQRPDGKGAFIAVRSLRSTF